MFKKLFSYQSDSLRLAAFLVAASSLLSRFLGVWRDRVLAGSFGLGGELDVYYASFRFPDLLYNLLVLGALSAGFIPTFSRLLSSATNKAGKLFKGEAGGKEWTLTNNVLNTVFLVMSVFCLLGSVFSPYLVKLISPGFSLEKQVLTAELSRIMFLSPLFLSFSGIVGGVLQSYNRFLVYSLSPIAYNLGIIFGAKFLTPVLGIRGLAWGVVLGAAAHLLVQFPLFYYLGWRWRPVLNWKDRDFLQIMKMMGPRALGLAVSQINLLIITAIASGLPDGSLAAFNYANNLQYLPLGVFGISFAVAAFPLFSRLVDQEKELVENFKRVFLEIAFFIIPASVFLWLAGREVINLLFLTGRFGEHDASLTMAVLTALSASLLFQAEVPLLTRMFYARGDAKTPFLAGLGSEIINIATALYCSARWGVWGLALAFSASSLANFAFLWLALSSKLKSWRDYDFVRPLFRLLAAVIPAAILLKFFLKLATPVGAVFFPLISIVRISLGLSFYFAFYFLIAYFLGSLEASSLWHSCCRRQRRKLAVTEDQGEARGL